MVELKEMGGYLPLELKKEQHLWNAVAEENIFAVNTGRTAIWCAVLQLKVRKLFLPYYYCPDVISMLHGMRIELSFYHIDSNLLPINVPDEEDSAVLLVNYYGLLTEQIYRIAGQYHNVILDQAHAFFAEPVLREDVMNIYSCRKFIGVSDGAYLIGKNLYKYDLPQDVSFTRIMHLLKCIETGTNRAYAESKESEKSLTGHFRMSSLTERILENADYKEIAFRRNNNTRILHEAFQNIQNLRLNIDEQVPYLYPLLLDRDIHKELVKKNIYVPYLWSQLLETGMEGTYEFTLAKNLVALPIDQRYGEEDMEYLVKTVLHLVD